VLADASLASLPPRYSHVMAGVAFSLLYVFELASRLYLSQYVQGEIASFFVASQYRGNSEG
jgi:hypothetical protein